MRSLLFALVLVPSVVHGGALWRPYLDWTCRREIKFPEMKRHPGVGDEYVVFVKLPTFGQIKPDGSDVRVATVDGAKLRSKVMWVGPGDYVSVAFEARRGMGSAYVYFGNPGAKEPEDWNPSYGLWLETRKFTTGECTNLKDFRQTIAQSGPIQGRGLVPCVFHSFNMFGPSENYISVYRGSLWVPAAGTYIFSTTSDNISYMLVDGHVVSEKREWTGAVGDNRFKGAPVVLTAGYHTFEYLHVKGGRGSPAAVAAWHLPGTGEREYKLIEPYYFPGAAQGILGAFEMRGKPITPDFLADNVGEGFLEPRVFYRFTFKDTTASEEALQYQTEWDFGDGLTSTSRNPQHVYLFPGKYTVTLSLSKGATSHKISQTIIAETAWEKQGMDRFDNLPDYYEILKEYQFENMATPALALVEDIFREIDKPDEIIKVGRILRTRKKELSEDDRFAYLLLLGTKLREVKKETEEAMDVFSDILNSCEKPLHKAHAEKELGDTLYYYYLKHDEALAHYKTVAEKYRDVDDPVVRVCLIRIGDIYRDKGDYKSAYEQYKLVESTTNYSASLSARAAKQGAYPQSVEEHLKHNDFAQAREILEAWEWDFPLEKLSGYSSYLRAQLAYKQQNYEEALKQSLALVKINKRSDWADRCLLLAGDAYIGFGKPEKAMEIVALIRRDYPETPFSNQTLFLECKALYAQKNYAEAAKKLLEFASNPENKDSELVPDFYLLAARCHIALKEKDKARKVFDTILKFYPDRRRDVENLMLELK